jgi:hypothetical protein
VRATARADDLWKQLFSKQTMKDALSSNVAGTEGDDLSLGYASDTNDKAECDECCE